ncbi:putative glycosyl hydrolase 5 (cellulase A) family protein [Lyophyllum shimeji]|uniref:Glycosyl hydrolase 5 (Cellulase A) family protein n=1 Tax=Lyophyllum shimeji TaxID=47721 RepID=A0A9P3USW2_LYOSH|nr:putative glycosyl hydrolase 5 (cellulase A) family protein [Lyophyllum shimeji]
MRSLVLGLALSSISLSGVRAGFPAKIYGVNLGSWLVLEPWMLPQEWIDMGGERCDDCSTCIASEFTFAQAYPDTVDDKFNEHWLSPASNFNPLGTYFAIFRNTWFNQDDVDKFVELGLNTVRIPLGYWIVEDLVDRTTEFYPRGGLAQLRRGLKQLSEAGIVAILDHHALPGIQEPGQQFTGRCTSDVQFYTPHNYHRALVWTAVMTALSHIDPAFDNVVSIEAVNEPIMDANQTPGYGDFQKNFVRVVRAVEFLLGLPVPSLNLKANGQANANATASLEFAAQLPPVFPPEIRSAILDAVPILLRIGVKLGVDKIFSHGPHVKKEPLITNFMDINWQHNNPLTLPTLRWDHRYMTTISTIRQSFGGVADPSETAYLTHNCNLDRIQNDAALGNSPLYFGEWALPTQFPATDEFLRKWADAQKRAYSMGAGWIFWNFKIEISDLAGDTARQWSYFEGVNRGYLTKDPSKLLDPHVCDPYLKNTTASA